MKNKLKKMMLKNKKGFTLVEVVVASLIVVIVSAMLITAFMTSSNINRQSFDKISDARNLGYDIYVNSDSAVGENVTMDLSQGGHALDGISIPMDVKTFEGERSGSNLLIFRNR